MSNLEPDSSYSLGRKLGAFVKNNKLFVAVVLIGIVAFNIGANNNNVKQDVRQVKPGSEERKVSEQRAEMQEHLRQSQSQSPAKEQNPKLSCSDEDIKRTVSFKVCTDYSTRIYESILFKLPSIASVPPSQVAETNFNNKRELDDIGNEMDNPNSSQIQDTITQYATANSLACKATYKVGRWGTPIYYEITQTDEGKMILSVGLQ